MTAYGLRTMPKEARNTARGLRFFDKLFDAMNGTNKADKSHPNRHEITDLSYHIPFFKEARALLLRIRFVNKDTHESEKVDVPSLKNMIWSIDAFLMIWKKLKKLGFESLNQRNLNQDTAENFFSNVRR